MLLVVHLLNVISTMNNNKQVQNQNQGRSRPVNRSRGLQNRQRSNSNGKQNVKFNDNRSRSNSRSNSVDRNKQKTNGKNKQKRSNSNNRSNSRSRSLSKPKFNDSDAIVANLTTIDGRNVQVSLTLSLIVSLLNRWISTHAKIPSRNLIQFLQSNLPESVIWSKEPRQKLLQVIAKVGNYALTTIISRPLVEKPKPYNQAALLAPVNTMNNFTEAVFANLTDMDISVENPDHFGLVKIKIPDENMEATVPFPPEVKLKVNYRVKANRLTPKKLVEAVSPAITET